MRIPDGRTDEYYNQEYLNPVDKEFLSGFDWCVETAVDNFFDNEMNGLQFDGSYLGHILCEKLPESMRDEYVMHYTFGDHEPKERKPETYADLIRMSILNWIEMRRNELITSMIDGMNEEAYNSIKEAVDSAKKAGQKGS